MNVCLTGGEVFTRPDLFELIDGVTANHMRYQLLSNGTLITERVLAQFEIGKRRQRLDSIQISIDGSCAEVHDLSRPHSFNSAIRGLRYLMAAKYPVTVRVTVNRYNVDDLENIAHVLLDEVGLPHFSTNEAYPCGATVRGDAGVMLRTAERRKAMRTLSDLAERYHGRITANAGPLVLSRELRKAEELLAQGCTSVPGRGTLSSCGGAFSQLAVLHDGTIVPCHNLSTLHMGQIGVDSLQEIWLNHPVMNAVRLRSWIPLDTLDTCHDCRYQFDCAGGCPGGAVFLTGQLNARNPMDCMRVHKGEDPYFTLP